VEKAGILFGFVDVVVVVVVASLSRRLSPTIHLITLSALFPAICLCLPPPAAAAGVAIRCEGLV